MGFHSVRRCIWRLQVIFLAFLVYLKVYICLVGGYGSPTA